MFFIKAQPGSVIVTLKGQTNYYSTMFEAALTSMKSEALGKLQVPAGEKAASDSATFKFDSAQDVNIAVKLLKDDTLKWQKYSMTLSGAVGGGSSNGGGKQDTSTSGLPDLVFSKVDYQEGPGSKRDSFKGTVVFCVKNEGQAEAGAFQVRLAIYNGDSENSELHGTPQYFQFAPLAGGKETCWHSSTESNERIFIGRGRLLWVDPGGGEVTESNEKNNKSWTNFPPRGVKY